MFSGFASHTFRISSRSISVSAAWRASQAASGVMSGMSDRSKTRFSLHSMAVWPSFLQFLHFTGGLSGHSFAACPSFWQIRQVPLKGRATFGFGQSAFEWPSSPQLKQPLPDLGAAASFVPVTSLEPSIAAFFPASHDPSSFFQAVPAESSFCQTSPEVVSSFFQLEPAASSILVSSVG